MGRTIQRVHRKHLEVGGAFKKTLLKLLKAPQIRLLLWKDGGDVRSSQHPRWYNPDWLYSFLFGCSSACIHLIWHSKNDLLKKFRLELIKMDASSINSNQETYWSGYIVTVQKKQLAAELFKTIPLKIWRFRAEKRGCRVAALCLRPPLWQNRRKRFIGSHATTRTVKNCSLSPSDFSKGGGVRRLQNPRWHKVCLQAWCSFLFGSSSSCSPRFTLWIWTTENNWDWSF